MRRTQNEESTRAGSIMDVRHVVILMQENRSFDHYFGTLRGVRGFGDRLPLPVPGPGGTVWRQRNDNPAAAPALVSPFHLDTVAAFEHMRVTGTPHTWPNAQRAWNQGIMDAWPTHKQNHAMGYYTGADLPYQFALANMFTVCDAYHSALQAGTNPNRIMAWTGSIDPLQQAGGPVIGNSYDHLGFDPQGGYAWTTYPERLQAAGVSWQIYQDMADNYTDNPLVGFRSYRNPANTALRARALTTRTLAQLRDDVQQHALPQVSYIIATADGSEHPVPSSPAQGAAYTAAVIEALASNPAVWAGTVLFVMFDENDGFFDHVPPPAVPSCVSWHADAAQAVYAGASTVSTEGEYHHYRSGEATEADDLMHRPYGLGPRVPMLVISPWSRGGWVNSQVFDHTSLIRFMEQRFGVLEPNISPWRRAVCGDLTSAFDFSHPDASPFVHALPDTAALAERARRLPKTVLPAIPAHAPLALQEQGTRPSRALPYQLEVRELGPLALRFVNDGAVGAVFHVYDKLRLAQGPRRYTVEPGLALDGSWEGEGPYDLWVLGPNGFHRHFAGMLGEAAPAVSVSMDRHSGAVTLHVRNLTAAPLALTVQPNAYAEPPLAALTLATGAVHRQTWHTDASGHWYDVSVSGPGGFVRRYAGRVETGRDSISDPALAEKTVAQSAWKR